MSDNTYHVILSLGPLTGAGITVDGFTIERGNANTSGVITLSGRNIARLFGGGINVFRGSNTFTNLKLLTNNGSIGGGLFASEGNNVISECLIMNNTTEATGTGGGLALDYNNNTLYNNLFYGNAASRGGGVYTVEGTATWANNTFVSNQASQTGGAFYTSNATNTFRNNIFWANLIAGNALQPGADFFAKIRV